MDLFSESVEETTSSAQDFKGHLSNGVCGPADPLRPRRRRSGVRRLPAQGDAAGVRRRPLGGPHAQGHSRAGAVRRLRLPDQHPPRQVRGRGARHVCDRPGGDQLGRGRAGRRRRRHHAAGAQGQGRALRAGERHVVPAALPGAVQRPPRHPDGVQHSSHRVRRHVHHPPRAGLCDRRPDSRQWAERVPVGLRQRLLEGPCGQPQLDKVFGEDK